MNEPWRIELLGALRARQGDKTVAQFRTQKTGALLAYLACHPGKPHSREMLAELLWPDDEPEASRNSLRVALNALRHRLEPPDVPPGAVLVADRLSVQLNPAACTTDVAEFEAVLQSAMQIDGDAERLPLLRRAVALYSGELLPGYEETWIEPERVRLAEAYLGALRRLVRYLTQTGDLDSALEYARRAIGADPLREEAHRSLMRLYAAVGQPSAALGQYRELERLLREELGERPSDATRALAEQLQRHAAEETPTPLPRMHPAPRPKVPAGAPPPAPASPQVTAAAPPRLPDGGRLPGGGRLPMQFTRFFGREEEIERLRTLLLDREARLVTLTGPGGTGKTRLAVEVARRVTEAFAGVVWFAELADLSDPRLIPGAIGDALRLPRSPNVEPLEQVVEALSQQPSLLVLDNFEHLVAGGASVIRTLLARAPALTCLVTSRRSLGLSGEHEFPVLPLPTPEGAQTPERLSRLASVQLFVDRRQAVQPDFQVTARNAPAVAALCRCLEGIPLAIELATARGRALTPAQMLEQLSQRFAHLANRRAGRGARHRSLWAAMDWSYHLLSPALQRLFARLSVFRGGWTLEAAQAVCEEPSALEHLTQLQVHSLVLAEESASASEMRFRMLETLREFAAEQLAPEERAALAGRHTAYYLALAEEAEPELKGAKQGLWMDRLEAEHDNLRAALDWAAQSGETKIGLRLAAALGWFWLLRAHFAEGREWLTRALSSSDAAAPAELRAKALNALGVLAFRQGEAARPFHEEALVLSRQSGDRYNAAQALLGLGNVAWGSGDRAQARSFYREALTLFTERGDRWGMATALNSLGLMVGDLGDPATARSLLEEGLAIRRELGDRWGIAASLNTLGYLACSLHEYAAARLFFEESLATLRESGHHQGLAYTLAGLGEVVFAQGDSAKASSLYQQSLELYQQMGDKRGVATQLENLAEVARTEGKPDRAVRLLAAVSSLHEAIGILPEADPPSRFAQEVTALRATLGQKTFARVWAEGRVLSLEQAVGYALGDQGTRQPGRATP